MLEDYGNASSIHWFGQRAKAGVEKAREQVARLLNARTSEIVFTSGGTESDNAAILGIVEAARGERKHVVTTAIEHPAVLSTAKLLEKRGVSVTYVRVGASGVIDPADVAARASAGDRADQRDARQQRAGHHSAAGGNRPHGARARHLLSHRRGAVGRAKFPWMWKNSAWICWRFPRTN